MQIHFDINDFLDYLLTGCLLLMALIQLFPEILSNFIIFGLNGNLGYIKFLSVLVTVSITLILGHFSSVFSRNIIRRILFIIFINPREKIFISSKDKFWTESFKKTIKDNFKLIFNYELIEKKDNKVAPRLIRSYVLNNFVATREIRNKIVRGRSLCANSVLPILILIASMFKVENYLACFLLFIIILAMLFKQHDLAIREWKEIYTAFAYNIK